MRAAPAFQKRMIPSSSAAMIASASVPRTASHKDGTSGPMPGSVSGLIIKLDLRFQQRLERKSRLSDMSDHRAPSTPWTDPLEGPRELSRSVSGSKFCLRLCRLGPDRPAPPVEFDRLPDRIQRSIPFAPRQVARLL